MSMKANQQVNTRQPYRIDVHHHVLPKFFLETLERVSSLTMFGVVLPDWSLEAHLEVMDKNKIAAGLASIPTGFYFENQTVARDLARRSNEYLAGLCRRHPTRFGALAALPLPDVDGALAEAAYRTQTKKVKPTNANMGKSIDCCCTVPSTINPYLRNNQKIALSTRLIRMDVVIGK